MVSASVLETGEVSRAHPMAHSTSQMVWSTAVKHTPSPLARGLTFLLVAASALERQSLEFRGSHLGRR